MSRIGFVGLGNMGLPMAINLAKAGHDLHVFDMVASQVEKAVSEGMTACASAAATAEGADAIMLMLPNGQIMKSVLNEIIPVAQEGAVVVDCSTVDVDSAKKAHELTEAAGLGCLDAPVSGGIAGAAAGTLTLMVGGSDASFESAKEILDVVGGRSVHCGGGGAGQAAKICNNMHLAVTMASLGEALSLGRKLGLEDQAMFDVMSTSSGFCWSLNSYCPMPGIGPQSPADNDFKPGFAASLMIKDAGLAQEAADSVGQGTPLGAHALELYKQYADATDEDMDFSGIINFLAEMKRGATS